VLCAASAIGDFLKFPSVMRAAETVGCPPRLCTVLGLIKVAASVGLIVGLDGNVVGTAAAAACRSTSSSRLELTCESGIDYREPSRLWSCSQSVVQLSLLPSEASDALRTSLTPPVSGMWPSDSVVLNTQLRDTCCQKSECANSNNHQAVVANHQRVSPTLSTC